MSLNVPASRFAPGAAGGGATVINVASFDPTNSEYLSITDASQTGLDQTGDMSIGGWFYLNDKSVDRQICRKWGAFGDRGYILKIDSAFSGEARWWQSPDGETQTSPENQVYDQATAEWVHLFFTHNTTTDVTSFYVNGALSDTDSEMTGTRYASADTFYVGSTGSGEYWDGEMCLLSIWSNDLPLSQIQDLYNSGNPKVYADLSAGDKTDLVSWWDMGETSGTRVDSHGSNDLTDNNTVGYTTWDFS